MSSKQSNIKITLIFFFLLGIGITSCNKELKETEKELLQTYIEENDINTIPTESGLYYLESGFSGIESINAPNPEIGDTVILTYKGYLLADTSIVFDKKTVEQPASYTFKKDNVIQGWEEGIGLMRTGISAQIIIPSELAYGDKQTGIIPPYSTIIFDIRVLEINNTNSD